ncbi:ABC transporter ATP-binding protein [Spirochaeta cellobiosiphila]|uniref:ABC transporter ATP-binding protein n=1 Tax=Spirochaeta cellobiosiphila TaxID=504483 RepID=UPI0004041C1A|nr:ABC transporter ATP-binding protein [Spirochaeta cellobiosiphila]
MDYEQNESVRNQSMGTLLKKIFKESGQYPFLLSSFIIFISVTALLEALGPMVLRWTIDHGVVAGSVDNIKMGLIYFGGLQLLLSISIFMFIWAAGLLGERLQYILRKKTFNKLQDLSFSFFDKHQVGRIMSRVTSDTLRISDLATWHLLDTLWGSLHIVTSLIFMLLINWKLALIIFASMPFLVWIAMKFKGHIIREFRKVRSLNSRMTGAYNETISGVKIIKSLVREDENLKDFSAVSSDMNKAAYRASWLSAMFLPAVQLMTAVALGAVFLVGGHEIQVGGLSLGSLQAFIGYITFMMYPIQDIARVFSEMQRGLASAERVFDLIEQEPSIKDLTNDSLPPIEGSIEFDNVGFHYSPDKPILENFNLKVKPGETIALVGPTGGGKSTIVNLVGRFYEPTSGILKIDGRDYKDYTQLSLQSQLGIVLQTPHLFSGTIEDNIRYGRLDATREEIEEAARLACAHDFIQQFPKGYEEDVGEGGNLLSVGQKQLISLARAILARPKIIILDEATSSVDTLTEANIQEGMDNLMAGTTSFVVAHRLSTIRKANRILVVEKGQIIEAGTHKELLKAGGHYHDLYIRQYRVDRMSTVI